MRMTRILRIIADKTKRVGVNPQYPRHPRSINPSFATNANKLTPYTQFKTDLDVSVRPLSVQKTNRIPVSSRPPEERRCQDARKSDWVHVIEEVRGLDEELRAESFVVRTGGHRTHGAQHLAAVRAAANDAHLRAAHALVIGLLAEAEAPAQTRAEIPLSRASPAVATDARRAVVDGQVFIVVKTGSDVVRAACVGVEDRAEAE